MPEAQSSESYFQIAQDRFGDGQALLRARRYAGACYISGYGVECSLKALLLKKSVAGQRPKVLKFFRGKNGHDLEQIKKKLRERGVHFPRAMTPHFASVNTWSVTSRYDTTRKTGHMAGGQLKAVEAVINWVRGEL
jgi:HEPN domain-containing protein